MIDSDWVVMGSVVIGDQRALVLGTQLPVEPDGRGQGEQPLADPGVDAGWGAAAVLLQLALEGVDDALDPLADRPQGAKAAGSSRRSGRTRTASRLATCSSTAAPATPLSTTRT